MAYRKFRADQLFDGFHLLDHDNVLITDEQGIIQEIVMLSQAGDDIQALRGILSPGFINCHCHLELSHMKGRIRELTGLVEFVLKVITERHHPEEEVLHAIEKAEDEMLVNGIVACGDICNNTLTIPQKLKGRIWYHNFIEASGFNPAIANERFSRSLGFFEAYGKMYSIPIASNSIVPHGPYSVSDELWEKIIHFPGNHLLTIHNQESATENQFFKTGDGELLELYEKMKMDVSYFRPSGKTSLQTYLPKFLRNQQVILVHNTHTSEADLLYCRPDSDRDPTAVLSLSKGRLVWCLCPNANKYITGDLPNVNLFIKHHCEIVLGTDSLASNQQLSILEEMKTIRNHFPDITISDLLKWGTSNGARALQMNAMLGSFEKGKKPGVILIDHAFNNVSRLL